MKQGLSINGVRFPEYRYIISSGLHKVLSGETSGPSSFSAVVERQGDNIRLRLVDSESYSRQDKHANFLVSIYLAR